MAKRSTLVFELERDQVVGAAQRAIADARGMGFEVSLSLVRRLLRVARSAPEFAVGAWWIDGRCGCLIGNLYGSRVDVESMSETEYWVGLEFDAQLVARLGSQDGDAYHDSHLNFLPSDMVVRVAGAA